MLELASRFEKGSLQEALGWYRAAARGGIAEAAERISRVEAKLAFEAGDHERAATLFSSVNGFDPYWWLLDKTATSLEACLAIARAFESGRLFEGQPFLTVNLDKAFEYYRRATYWGHRGAYEKVHTLRPRATRALVKDFTGTLAQARRMECDRTFQASEWEDIQRGLASYSMDDKWIFFVEDESLFILRSWTGELWGIAHFEPALAGVRLTHVDVTSSATASDESLLKLLYWLIDRFLLGNLASQSP